jgi:2-desacetyl-2-hydroxyethyl bacteriochlorophyllide A dehydrogenase
MRAIVIDRPGIFRVAEVPDPAPRAGQVVVQVEYCGICGTDLHILAGEFPPTPYPITPGHEFAGTVVARGPDVKPDLPIGARVAVDPSLYCGYCRRCRAGRDNLCENWAAIGDTVDGAFAEFVAVPAVNAYRLPDHVDSQYGAMAEPLACAVHGLRRLGPVFGDPVVVIGAGTMGLLLLQVLLASGAGPVAVVDRVSERLEVARKLGADAAVTDASALAGERFEVAVDATGVPAAIESAVGLLDRGGRLLVFGVSPAEAAIRVSPFRVYNDELTITGSMAILRSFGQAVDLLASGAVDPRLMLSEPLPLEEFGEAVNRVRSGQGIKWHIRPLSRSLLLGFDGIARLLGRTARPALRGDPAGEPSRVGQGAAEQELDLGVGTAQLVGRPAGQRVVDGRVEPQQDVLPLTHRDRSLVERAGVDDLLGGLLAAEHHQQVGDHRGLALLVKLHHPLLLQALQGQPDHADRALHDGQAGADHGRGLLLAEHGLRDLRRVGQPGQPGLDHVDPGRGDPLGDLGGQLRGDLGGVLAQGKLSLAVTGVRVGRGDVPHRGLGLDRHELREVIDRVQRHGRVGDLPHHDGGDLDRVPVRVVDLGRRALVVPDPDRHPAPVGQHVHPVQPRLAERAPVPAEQLDHPGLPGDDRGQPLEHEPGREQEQHAERDQPPAARPDARGQTQHD